jgi:predicted transcriptional regulator of viral defense system
MLLHDAITHILADQGFPIVVDYELFHTVRDLYRKREYSGEKLKIVNSAPSQSRYRRIVGQLLLERYLRPDADYYPDGEWPIPAHPVVFRVSDVPDGPAEEVTAHLDPFCYLSHLSAMQRYNLTNRIPEFLTLSTPQKWTAARDRKYQDDFDDIASSDEYRVALRQLKFPSIIRGRPVTLHKTVRSPHVKSIRGSHARIASVGEVFVQMLDRPELCGGMEHVIEVWDASANTFVEEIIAAVSTADEAIVKVRAGFLLEERLSVRDGRVMEWAAFAQRGGSRKLDPRAAYAPKHSEKWMISINV